MNQEIRVKRLLNKVKKKYGIKDKIRIKLIKKETKTRSYLGDALMEFNSENKIPTIYIFSKNGVYRFEKIPDWSIERDLSHELTHFLAYKHHNEKDAKKIIKALKLIDRMIKDRKR